MVRVISQETYDEVVKENMEDFEMTPQEAIKEAISQFEAQGIDLSNIIKDLVLVSGEEHLVSKIVKTLKELCSNQVLDQSMLSNQIGLLKEELDKGIAHRVKAGKEGAYEILLHLLEVTQQKYLDSESNVDIEFLISIYDTLCSLMDMQPDLLNEVGMEVIESSLEKVKDDKVLVAVLKWTNACCVKHEGNRQKLFTRNIAQNLKQILVRTKNQKLISETLQLVRRMTLDDDVRVEIGKAHERARDMALLMIEPLSDMLKEDTKSTMVSQIMSTISSLLVRNEFCKMAADRGINVLFNILADNYENSSVIRQASGLITALAGNDEVKRDLVKSGIVPIIVTLLNRHSSCANTTACLLKCIAALTLREPTHSKLFLENGTPDAVVGCMKVHQDNPAVQKEACRAIRNMVARCREYNAKFHELGVEGILNTDYEKFNKDFGFEIKSALRDLECDVKLEEQWKGTGAEIDY